MEEEEERAKKEEEDRIKAEIQRELEMYQEKNKKLKDEIKLIGKDKGKSG